MLVVGLTGGIGSGKSTVANLFAKLGVPIIDTDIIAREVVTPGSEALQHIQEKMGKELINNDGTLNRQRLRDEVFENPSLKEWLEALLHPLIRAKTAKQIQKVDHPYCIVVIPLLAETWPHPLIDSVLVVDCSEQTQLQRASARDANTHEQIQKIMASQASRTQRLAIADEIITNDTDLDDLKAQVARKHVKYLKSAN